MTPNDDSRWRALLRPPVPPRDFAASVLASVRERRAASDAALDFDITATRFGIAGLRPGSGAIHADSARARALAERAREELGDYLAGARSYFSVPIDLSGMAPFQRDVLDTARSIPFGDVRSYGWVAKTIGNPKAVRAVGTALGRNPVMVIVPCHRVLRSDGSLGGYAYCLKMKSRFLALEHETPALVGSSTARIICRHGCAGAQRIPEEDRIVFASVREARSAGYRLCKDCLPGKADLIVTSI